jgi:hypothetical protein
MRNWLNGRSNATKKLDIRWEFYRKLARNYEIYKAGVMTTACEESARHCNEIDQDFEQLAELHSRPAAAAQWMDHARKP